MPKINQQPSNDPLTQNIAHALLQQQAMLCCAESCTGGGIAKTLTDQAGSSAWFDRGFVTYSNQAKQQMLGISPALLATHGAVSQAVVQAMVVGALQHSAAQFALAVTGVAGPGGGTTDKPTGTVWLAWASTHGALNSSCEHFVGDRIAVRAATVNHALRGMLRLLEEKNPIQG